MRDVLRPTGGKIVHPDNAMPIGNQAIRNMTSDKPSRASNE